MDVFVYYVISSCNVRFHHVFSLRKLPPCCLVAVYRSSFPSQSMLRCLYLRRNSCGMRANIFEFQVRYKRCVLYKSEKCVWMWKLPLRVNCLVFVVFCVQHFPNFVVAKSYFINSLNLLLQFVISSIKAQGFLLLIGNLCDIVAFLSLAALFFCLPCPKAEASQIKLQF